VSRPISLIQGSLDLLILSTLQIRSGHAWGIRKRIHEVSRNLLHIPEGSLYPSLYRMEKQGWVVAEWSESGSRRTKIYSITMAGSEHVRSEIEQFLRVGQGIYYVIDDAGLAVPPRLPTAGSAAGDVPAA